MLTRPSYNGSRGTKSSASATVSCSWRSNCKSAFQSKRPTGISTTFLAEGRPDVVHITTPPQSHFEIAKTCLNRGCHVYVEKPFTVNAAEAEALIGLAREKGLKITAGHDDQFRPATRRMRSLVKSGYLGEGPSAHGELLRL